MRIKGIDVSGYNVVKDYNAVAADNVDFAIIKVIRKDLQPDKLFETHWSGFENAGVPIQGVYNYSYATTAAKFRSDAQRVMDVLAGRKTMVWLDIEDVSLRGLGVTLAEGIRAYAEVIQGAGLQFGVYTYVSFYNNYLKKYSDMLQFPFWIARYPSTQVMDNDADPDAAKCPDVGKTLYGWQYSSTGRVKGIDGNVDLNEWYVEIEAKEVAPVPPAEDYIGDGFRKELAKTLGLSENSSTDQILKKTVTVSANNNRYHASVTPLERLLKEHGYYTGAIEADEGKKPIFGNGMAKATALYQAEQVKLKKPDKEWTARNKSYKKALQLS